MPAQSYKTRAIVLRKNKLGEKDLIVTLLDGSGALIRAVAKGARKPGGSYAAKLDLFCCVDLQLAKGKNLDVITSAKLEENSASKSFGVEQTACASVLAELLATVAQEGLHHERLFAMSHAAFDSIACEEPLASLGIATSALLKALAYAGFRPSFSECVVCGEPIEAKAQSSVSFSVSEGGAVCASCRPPSDAVRIDAQTILWAEALLRSRFDDVASFQPGSSALFAILQIIRQWTRVHASRNLKSLDFLFTCGLF